MEETKYTAADSTARKFFLTSVFFLVLAAVVGLVIALQVAGVEQLYPLNFARFRPLHVSLIAFGWLSMVLMGFIYYIVPREVNRDLASPLMANLHYILMTAGIPIIGVSYLLGFSTGRSYAEPVFILDLVVVVIWLLFVVNLVLTIAKGQFTKTGLMEKGSLIFIMVSVFYLGVNYLISMLPVTGVRDSVATWTWAHNAVNGWFMVGLIGCLFYMLPRLTGLKFDELFDKKIFHFLFWPMMLFIPASVYHHVLYEAAPVNFIWKLVGEWTSIGMLVPTAVLLYIIYTFMKNSKKDLGLVGKFLVLVMIFYGITCLQGAFSSVRAINTFFHGTHWVVSHAHLALGGWISFGFYSLLYFVWPQVTGRELFSEKQAHLHRWTALIGLVGMFAIIGVGGYVEAGMYASGSSFFSVHNALGIYFIGNVGFGVIFLLSTLILANNLIKTIKQGQELSETTSVSG